MPRLGVEEFGRLHPEACRLVWLRFGLLQYDEMATASPAQKVPDGYPQARQPLPFVCTICVSGTARRPYFSTELSKYAARILFPTHKDGGRPYAILV